MLYSNPAGFHVPVSIILAGPVPMIASAVFNRGMGGSPLPKRIMANAP